MEPTRIDQRCRISMSFIVLLFIMDFLYFFKVLRSENERKGPF